MGGIIFVTLCGIEFVTLGGIVLVQQGGIVFVGLGSIIVGPLAGFFFTWCHLMCLFAQQIAAHNCRSRRLSQLADLRNR